jgi:hypothetical protein
MLYVENAHRNPTMIAFCQMLSHKLTMHVLLHASTKLTSVADVQLRKTRARQRWHLAMTLLRNLSLISLRKHKLAIAKAKKKCVTAKKNKESETFTEFSFIA